MEKNEKIHKIMKTIPFRERKNLNNMFYYFEEKLFSDKNYCGYAIIIHIILIQILLILLIQIHHRYTT